MAIAPKKLTRLLRASSVRHLLAAGDTTKPLETPRPLESGENPDRILMLGNGALNGWGVTRNDETVPGHLARLFEERAHHAVHVDVVGDPPAVAADLPALLRAREIDLLDYDAAVVIIGVSDALQATPASAWTAAVTTLLEVFRREAPALDVVWMGAQPPSSVPLLDQAPGGPADRLAAEHNAITARLCTGRVRFLQPPAIPVLGPRTRTVEDPAEIARASAGYLAWAETLVESLLALRETSQAWGR